MSIVLVFGGSGFVGCHVAKAFRRAGYRVYAASRSGNRSHELLQAEVIPININLNEPATFHPYIEKADIVVDATMGEGLKIVVDATIEIAKATQHKKTLLMTGGAGIYVTQPGELISERSQKKKEFVNAARIDVLLEALKSPHVKPVGFLPPIVLGEDMGRWGNAFFEYVKLHDDGSAVVDLYGDPNRKMPAIHVRDLAAAYVLAAQNINAVAGEEFVVGSDGPSHTWEEVQRRVAELMGANPAKISVKVREPANFVESFRNFSGGLNCKKIHDLLGWKAVHGDYFYELDLYYAAWKAHTAKSTH
eukprot:TRINITY_DN9955_c0_g1_i1.p1 TRINITY_DN9955_c0_g1~~TRINITY_DN9955_c0_g1_i1.p1  ORF type:complete len:305 (+),score=68.58 TRINITY_DN9955_c0_g1_i1:199-1113(+)